jgi:hypothetical protein
VVTGALAEQEARAVGAGVLAVGLQQLLESLRRRRRWSPSAWQHSAAKVERLARRALRRECAAISANRSRATASFCTSVPAASNSANASRYSARPR